MAKYTPIEARKKLETALTEYQTHLKKDLEEAKKAWTAVNDAEDKINSLNDAAQKAKKAADDAVAAYEALIKANPEGADKTVSEAAQKEAEAVQKQLDNATQAKLDAEANLAKQSNTPRVKLATEKLAVIDQLIKDLPTEDTLKNLKTLEGSFQQFATTLTNSIDTMSKIRRNGTFTDSDTTVAFLKGLAIILTGVVPGLIAYGVMQYCGFFNATGKNVATAMQDTLDNVVPAPAA